MRFFTLAAAVVLTSSISAQASIFIDTFDVPNDANGQEVTSGALNVLVSNTESGLDMNQVIGGQRTLEVTKLEGGRDAVESQLYFMGVGDLGVSNDTGVRSLAEVIWDNFDDPMTMDEEGYDLVTALTNKGTTVAETSILIDITSIDLNGLDLSFTITDTNGQSATLFKVIDNPQVVVKPLTDFLAVNAALDLTSIRELRFTTTTAPGEYDRDLTIDLIKFGNPVPEPASMALMGLGSLLAGCGVMRRKRKNAEEMVA